MPDSREVRRICGFLSVRQSRLHFDRVPDHRDRRGRRWKLDTLLFSTLLGVMTGQKSFADVEQLTASLSVATRHLLGIRRQVPDTTLRDALSTVEPQDLRPILHSATRSAHRSKSLGVDFELPFGVVSMDGKYVTVPAVDDRYSQLITQDIDQGRLSGRIGTMTAVLSSSQARPCIDVYPIPAVTNEMGVFERALDALLAAYGPLDLFRLVTYDAGACSKANAQHIRVRGLHYLLSLKGSQPELSYWAQLWLGQRSLQQADAVTEPDRKNPFKPVASNWLAEHRSKLGGRSVPMLASTSRAIVGSVTSSTNFSLPGLPVIACHETLRADGGLRGSSCTDFRSL